MRVLSDYIANRDNNFNLIRFVAASFVLFSHSFPLSSGRSATDPLTPLIGISLGDIAVDVFFILSGFLIIRSLLTRNNLIAFAWNRALRIYPALFVAIIFCVFIVGLSFTKLDKILYLSSPITYEFLIKNITLIFGGYAYLPNVFDTTPWDKAVNGSLWTLVWEVRMYGVLFILGILYTLFNWFNEKRFLFCILIIALTSWLLFVTNHYLGFINHEGASRGLRLMAMFFVGSSFYALNDKIFISLKVTAVMTAALIVAMFKEDVFFTLYYLFIGYIIFSLSYIPAGVIRKFNKLGDYSYGIYIYAFPVQQSIAELVPGISILEMVVFSFFITFILAFASWHLIEKRMMKNKNKYIHIEKNIKHLKRRLSIVFSRL